MLNVVILNGGRGASTIIPSLLERQRLHVTSVVNAYDDGKSTGVKQLKLEAGMLSLFQGHYSIHRVTEVRGVTQRIQAILGYTTKPALVGSIKSSILHYGSRVALGENQ